MSVSTGKEIQFIVREGAVSGLLHRPDGAVAVLALAHGAGGGMRHRFMEALAVALAERRIATLRYQFPYMEKRVKRPDPESVLTDTVRAAVAAARKHAGDLPLFAGGKSMGGRMTALAAAKSRLDGVRGLIYFGFPLHAAGRPGVERSQHLAEIGIPMLFLQGSRDALADLKKLRPVCKKLKGTELFIVEGADHSFHMLKSAGVTDEKVLESIAAKAADWMLDRI